MADTMKWVVVWFDWDSKSMKTAGPFESNRDASLHFAMIAAARKWIVPLPWQE